MLLGTGPPLPATGSAGTIEAMSESSSLRRALDALNDAERVHYDRLAATTALLADISFADILLLLPAAGIGDDDEGGRVGGRARRPRY